MLKSLVMPAAKSTPKKAPVTAKLVSNSQRLARRGSMPAVSEFVMGAAVRVVLISSLPRRPCGG